MDADIEATHSGVDRGTVAVVAHVLIRDRMTGQVMVDKRDSVLARTLRKIDDQPS